MMLVRTARHRPRNRGSIYVCILGLSLLVATIGVGGIAITRAQSRTNDLRNDVLEARSYCRSAIELARAQINNDLTWRTDYSNGAWYTNQAIGSGTFSLTVTNPNGTLNHADSDPIVLVATGTKGQAIQKIQVTLTPTFVPLTCLNTSATAGTLVLNSTSFSGAGSTIASNSTINATGSGVIYPNAAAVGTITGHTFENQTWPNSAAQTMPNSHVFDYYLANGTTIPYSSLPGGGTSKNLNNGLLSPTANTFSSTTNSNGIYIIDCANGTITINNVRVVGTLVLLNVGNNSIIQNSCNFAPAITNFPCLLVSGPISIKLDPNITLKDGGGVNYNPAGTPYPYPTGTANNSTSDTYPNVINGFAYVSGDCTVDKTTFDTLIVGGTLTTLSAANPTFVSTFYGNPPPGFYTVQMKPLPGAFLQVVN